MLIILLKFFGIPILGDPYGRKCDIWSVGCTVFQMLTGRTPWSNRTRKLEEFTAIIYEMSDEKNPLTFFGKLEPFTDERVNFTRDAEAFLLACFAPKAGFGTG